ncbi:MAG: electron transport complex protein RnfA [Erysipelotrichaceae bacterium]
MNLFSMFIAAALINNVVLSKFLGLCPFLGVSKKTESALGMGGAVTFVIMASAAITWVLNYYVLVPFEIEYMYLIVFILVIASFVQLTEIIIKKFLPALYKSLGIYLPLITTNCAVLFVARENISQGYNFVESMVSAFGVSVGFVLVLYIFSTIRVKLQMSNPPKAFQGNPIAFIVAAVMALALTGLAGIV